MLKLIFPLSKPCFVAKPLTSHIEGEPRSKEKNRDWVFILDLSFHSRVRIPNRIRLIFKQCELDLYSFKIIFNQEKLSFSTWSFSTGIGFKY